MSELHVVFGASGGAGGAVVRALAASGARVRAVSRSGRGSYPEGVEAVRADATDAAAAREAGHGADVMHHCVNVPYSEWVATLPAVMTSLVAAAEESGARLVYCDNLYMYGEVEGPITEETPRRATGVKGRLRIELADRLLEAHAAGRVRAVIVRGSDFFGPGAPNTLAGQLVFPAVVEGRKARWIGSLDQPHSLNYIDDFARCMVTLAGDPRADGEVWHVPAGPALTARAFIERVFEVAGRPPKIGVYPRWMVRLAGLFDAQLREGLEVLHQFERPFVLDASKYTRAFGEPGLTPLPDAIARTLAWQESAAD